MVIEREGPLKNTKETRFTKIGFELVKLIQDHFQI